MSTFGTKRVIGPGALALPYVTVPEITASGVGVKVAVEVAVGVFVFVAVGVSVAVFVAV